MQISTLLSGILAITSLTGVRALPQQQLQQQTSVDVTISIITQPENRDQVISHEDTSPISVQAKSHEVASASPPSLASSLVKFVTKPFSSTAAEGGVEKIASLDRYTEVLNTKFKVAVLATAEWCGACRSISPTFSSYANDFPGIYFIKFDVDEAEYITMSLGISTVPTFLFYERGTIVEKFAGANVPKLKDSLQKLA